MIKTSRIVIVQIAPPQNVGQGDYFYRVESPGRALAELEEVQAVISITNISENKIPFLLNADVVIINHVCDPDLIPIIQERKRRGLLTVFEMGDNIEDVQPWNPTYQFWKRDENKQVLYHLISVCDVVQANNVQLLKLFGKWNKTRAVFPNHLFEIPPSFKLFENNQITIGWGGSYGHLDDLKWIAPHLIDWFKNHPSAKLYIMGSKDFMNLFTEIPANQKKHFEPGSLKDYYRFLSLLDIGLAPLKNTAYNRCRSDVKFIEYGGHGVVPVLQDLTPYQSENIPGGAKYLFKNPWQLPLILDQFYDNKDFAISIAQKAYQYVKENRLENQHSRDRLNFYLSRLRNRVSTSTSGYFRDLSGYIPVGESRFENNLFNGLVYLESYGDREKAYRMFTEAEKLSPDSYLPNLFRSQCAENPVPELEKALRKNPDSIKTRFLVADYYKKIGEYKSAIKTLREVIRIAPDFKLPYLKSAELLRLLGLHEQADQMIILAEGKDKPSAIAASGEKEIKAKNGKTPASSVYLVMPVGYNFGWGICGKYLAREMSSFTKIHFLSDRFTAREVGDELEYAVLSKLSVSEGELKLMQDQDGSVRVESPVIQAIQGSNLLPWKVRMLAPALIGYTFFEDNILKKEAIAEARNYFDVIVAGSRWNEEMLRDNGLENTRTIIQGIDPSIFNPYNNRKFMFSDRFVIFSGGKFEFRKGQDLVIRAFKHLQQKYDDVLLVNSWFNHWEHSLKTMAASPYINFQLFSTNYEDFIRKLLSENGIDLEKVIILPPKPNIAMARIYKNTDIGIFPNRCEGGTNLVLMEYMACGKPVIASFSTGHKDIVNEENAILIKKSEEVEMKRDGVPVAVWDNPDLDEIVEKLEWAYLNRDRLEPIGKKAGEDLAKLTWHQSAKQFYELAISFNS